MTRPVVAHGGSGGLTANLPELLALSGDFARAAADLRDAHRDVSAVLFGPWAPAVDLVDGGPSAVAAAQARAAARDALAELDAATWLAEQVALRLRSAFTLYRDADGGLVHRLAALQHAQGAGEVALLRTGDPSLALQVLATDDPDNLVVAAHATVLGLDAALLEALARDRGGLAVPTGTDGGGIAGRPPRSLTDLLADLARRDDDPRPGEIDVRILTLPDGTRRVVVDLPGTKTFSVAPSPDVADGRADLVAVTGRSTAYERGVLDALRRAGVTRHDDVLLVGHSLGGMVAVNTAAHLARSGRYRVTHVVTAGSPVGRTVGRVPAGTQVLALEDRHDLVPRTDERANPDRPNVTTVATDRGRYGRIVDDHDLRRTYLPAAADTEASRNRSVRHALAGLRGYLGATSVTTHTYQLRRT